MHEFPESCTIHQNHHSLGAIDGKWQAYFLHMEVLRTHGDVRRENHQKIFYLSQYYHFRVKFHHQQEQTLIMFMEKKVPLHNFSKQTYVTILVILLFYDLSNPYKLLSNLKNVAFKPKKSGKIKRWNQLHSNLRL